MNLELIKQKLGEVKSQKNQSKYVWKPKAGNQVIRIVPYKFNKENPFIELYFHYKIAKSMLSPITFGRPDPAVKLSEKLLNKNDKDAYKLAKQIEPKLRVYVPIVERGKENEGVKFWGIGKTLYEELLEYIADPEWGDISDIHRGNDILVTYKDAKETGKDFGDVKIKLKPSKTPLMPSKEEIRELFESEQDILTIFKEPTYEEVQEALDEYIDSGKTKKSEDDIESEFKSPSKPKPSVSEEFDMSDFDTPAPKSSSPRASSTNEDDDDDVIAQFEKEYNS